MASLPFLPDNILQKLICHECFRYLSVPPIASNICRETICGRCLHFNESVEVKNKYTKSSYNIIAEGFLFKCINHYNGCSQLVGLTEAEEHEKNCKMTKQECFFCSFSGVLSQILYHTLKVHPDNLTYDGKLDFFLNDMSFHKKTVFILNDYIFLVTIKSTDVLFTIQISTISQSPPSIINQFGVKIFKPEDPSNVNYLDSGYGVLDTNLANYFEKSKDELTTVFGPGVILCCQILVGPYSIERELDFKQKFLMLSQCETELNNLRKELDIRDQNFLQQTNVWEQKLAERDQLYNAAINTVKKMSWNFRCYSCQKVVLAEIYFCSKNHFFCKMCLKNICKGCDSIQEFKQLNEIENILVSCDWSKCKEMTSLKDYMEHKTLCLNRPYKCPLEGCNVDVISLQSFLEHLKDCLSLPINQESSISCGINQFIDCYWVVNGDLYHVNMKLNNKAVRVFIHEVDVLPSKITFKCQGRNPYDENIHFSNFHEKYDIDCANVNGYYNNINIYFD